LLRDACDFGGLLKIDKKMGKVTTTLTFDTCKAVKEGKEGKDGKEGKKTTDKREPRRTRAHLNR
jgi:hypothetical protein